MPGGNFKNFRKFSPIVNITDSRETSLDLVVVVVVVMTSLSGTAYMGGQRGPEEMRNSTRL